MKRRHVLEFEDLPSFPSWLRACVTDTIVVFARFIGIPQVLGDLVAKTLQEQKLTQVVDLGSGSGGVMPDVLTYLREMPELAQAELTMTDLYPNPAALERFSEGPARYQREAVDATDLAHAPPGLKTMVNSFHHLRPEQAKAVLQSAVTSRQPSLIYERADNKRPVRMWVLGLPLGLSITGAMSMVFGLMVRPYSFKQFFFTYCIPLIPLFYAWDGQASMPRIYCLTDLDELLEGLHRPDYRWEKGEAKNKTGQGIYLIGQPC
jgi:hypothetical protein